MRRQLPVYRGGHGMNRRTPKKMRQRFFVALGHAFHVTWPVLSAILAFQLALGLLTGFVEGWSLGDAVYFTFITGLTIGYGDLVPRQALTRALSIVIGFSGLLPRVSSRQLRSTPCAKRSPTAGVAANKASGRDDGRVAGALEHRTAASCLKYVHSAVIPGEPRQRRDPGSISPGIGKRRDTGIWIPALAALGRADHGGNGAMRWPCMSGAGPPRLTLCRRRREARPPAAPGDAAPVSGGPIAAMHGPDLRHRCATGHRAAALRLSAYPGIIWGPCGGLPYESHRLHAFR